MSLNERGVWQNYSIDLIWDFPFFTDFPVLLLAVVKSLLARSLGLAC
jgi:hypothetical protein